MVLEVVKSKRAAKYQPDHPVAAGDDHLVVGGWLRIATPRGGFGL